MTKKTRMFTGLVAAAMVLVLLFSALYIAVEADHSCTGENCAVCCQITLCRQLLEGLGLAGTVAVLTAALPRFMLRAALPTAECAGVFTLVALKVKLSD